jgi:membrane protease YdiL (CAAX protease family)
MRTTAHRREARELNELNDRQTGADAAAPPQRIAGIVAAFLGVTVVMSWLIGAVQPSIGVPSEVIELVQFGPSLGVLAVLLFWPGRVRVLLAGSVRVETFGPGRAATWQRALLLAGGAVLMLGLAVGAYAVTSGDARFTSPSSLENPFALIVIAQLVGACGEELGWRCLLQPLLRTRFGPLAASVIVGLLWGCWHVQVFAEGPLYAASFLLAAVSMSVVLGLGLEQARSSRLLLAGGFHMLINLGLLLFMDEESAAEPTLLFGAAGLVVAAVAVVVFRGRKRAASIHRVPQQS